MSSSWATFFYWLADWCLTTEPMGFMPQSIKGQRRTCIGVILQWHRESTLLFSINRIKCPWQSHPSLNTLRAATQQQQVLASLFSLTRAELELDWPTACYMHMCLVWELLPLCTTYNILTTSSCHLRNLLSPPENMSPFCFLILCSLVPCASGLYSCSQSQSIIWQARSNLPETFAMS